MQGQTYYPFIPVITSPPLSSFILNQYDSVAGGKEVHRIGLGLFDLAYHPLAKFHIRTSLSSLPTFQIEALINGGDGGVIMHLFSQNNQVYGIYQKGIDFKNYFEGEVGCKSLVFDKPMSGISITNAGEFPFVMRKSQSAQFVTRFSLFNWGAKVYGKFECDDFRLINNSGGGKVLVSDATGNGNWTDPSMFINDYWRGAEKDKNIYLNKDYGKVGIGTDNPLQKLHVVNGSILISRQEGQTKDFGSLNGSILFGEVVTEDFPGGEWGIEYYNPGTEFITGGLNFWQVASEHSKGSNYNLFLGNDGNVGIGTSNTHDYKLAVTGKVLCEEMKVKLVKDWPDYVFCKEHKLPSLTEVDHFISENKHLPDVPTLDEVRENGINVGEMNAILLKKVEELTLYLISMEKEIAQLKAKVASR